MSDHVGIYGSRVAEGLSAFNVGLVRIWYQNPLTQLVFLLALGHQAMRYGKLCTCVCFSESLVINSLWPSDALW